MHGTTTSYVVTHIYGIRYTYKADPRQLQITLVACVRAWMQVRQVSDCVIISPALGWRQFRGGAGSDCYVVV